jgi:hypothetical protein
MEGLGKPAPPAHPVIEIHIAPTKAGEAVGDLGGDDGGEQHK